VSLRIVLILCILAPAAPVGAQPATQPALTPPDRTIRIQKEADVYVLGFSAGQKNGTGRTGPFFCGQLDRKCPVCLGCVKGVL
jgi:hypothetical protein